MKQKLAGPEGVDTAQAGYAFKPTGLNDNLRHVLVTENFVAADDPLTKKRDDAVRVRRFSGGYLMETAVADCSQLEVDSALVLSAIERWSNRPANRLTPNPLPLHVARKLHLGDGNRRALVVVRQFDSELRPHDDPLIVPATVRVKTETTAEFGREVKKAVRSGETSPIAEFHDGVRRKLLSSTGRPGWELRNTHLYGQRIIHACMVLSNIAVADWAAKNSVPLIYKKDPSWQDHIAWRRANPNHTEKIMPFYTVEPVSYSKACRFTGKDETAYAPFTSPLRFLAALLNHQQVGAKLAGEPLPYSKSDMAELVGLMNTVQAVGPQEVPKAA